MQHGKKFFAKFQTTLPFYSIVRRAGSEPVRAGLAGVTGADLQFDWFGLRT